MPTLTSGTSVTHQVFSGLDVEKFTGGPTDYKITKCSAMKTYVGWGGDGPKPSGISWGTLGQKAGYYRSNVRPFRLLLQ